MDYPQLFKSIIFSIGLLAVCAFIMFVVFWSIVERHNTKPGRYGNTACIVIPFGNKNRKHTFPEEALSEKELAAYKVLSQIKPTSPYHYSIREAIHSNSPGKFRELIYTLRSQALNSTVISKKILGEDGFNAVMDLEVQSPQG